MRVFKKHDLSTHREDINHTKTGALSQSQERLKSHTRHAGGGKSIHQSSVSQASVKVLGKIKSRDVGLESTSLSAREHGQQSRSSTSGIDPRQRVRDGSSRMSDEESYEPVRSSVAPLQEDNTYEPIAMASSSAKHKTTRVREKFSHVSKNVRTKMKSLLSRKTEAKVVSQPEQAPKKPLVYDHKKLSVFRAQLTEALAAHTPNKLTKEQKEWLNVKAARQSVQSSHVTQSPKSTLTEPIKVRRATQV